MECSATAAAAADLFESFPATFEAQVSQVSELEISNNKIGDDNSEEIAKLLEEDQAESGGREVRGFEK